MVISQDIKFHMGRVLSTLKVVMPFYSGFCYSDGKSLFNIIKHNVYFSSLAIMLFLFFILMLFQSLTMLCLGRIYFVFAFFELLRYVGSSFSWNLEFLLPNFFRNFALISPDIS